jgi:serine/threonine protein kinase
MALTPGTLLGSYEIVAPIGSGGMGEVYKARDPKLDRYVAVKVLPPSLAENGDLLARFEREAKAVAALSHPNVLGIHDFGTDGHHTFAVMELLEGENLRERLKQGALAPRKAVEIALQVAEGLAAAHARGIIHRDIKPENVFLTRDGRVKVLDFGLAKQVLRWSPAPDPQLDLPTHPDVSALRTGLPAPSPRVDSPPPTALTAQAPATPLSSPAPRTPATGIAPASTLTEAGLVMGTLGYMAPEQARGVEVDHRCDVFAFGVMLYEMLSGQRPFRGETAHQTVKAVLHEDPPELSAPRGAIPPGLERLVLHCLEKDPEARFQSMKDIAFDLSSMTDPGAVERRRGGPRSWRFKARWMAAGAAGLAAAGLLAAALGWPPFARAQPPAFTRLTFEPGTVESAFFGPDGRTVYFSLRRHGGRPGLFVLSPGALEPRALGVEDAVLLGVSAGNDLAILQGPRRRLAGRYRGVLATVGGNGGPAREVQANVYEAAWDGQGFATYSVDDQARFRLEFPAGRVVDQGNSITRTLKLLRISPDGEWLAMVEADTLAQSRLVLLSRSGERKVLLEFPGDAQGESLTGLAWGPKGELWASELQGDQTAVWALAPGGKPRILWRGEGSKQLLDVSAEGRMLLANHQVRRGVMIQKAGGGPPEDVSVLGGSQAQGLSADGRSVLLLESKSLDGGTTQDLAFIVRDGAALKLSRGNPQGLSPDGQWVLLGVGGLDPESLDPAILSAFREAGLEPKAALDPKAPQPHLLFVPTGMGRPFVVPLPANLEGSDAAYLLPDGKRVVFNSSEKGQSAWYLIHRSGGAATPLTRPGLGAVVAGLSALSPDGTRLIVTGDLKDYFIQPLTGGPPARIQGLQPGERVVGWSGDGLGVIVRPELSVLPVALARLDLASGARRPLIDLGPPDTAGHLQTRGVYAARDARTFAFTYDRKLSELYRVEGLK